VAEADPKKLVYNVHEAKTHFSKLIDRAHAGEEIIVAKDGTPYARLLPLASEPRKPRQPGRYQHLLGTISEAEVMAPVFTGEELASFEAKLDDI
jgi:prevent-host-death family protein